MKIKQDFVTNSSSASYILTLRPHDGTMDLEEFKDLFNRFLDDYKFRNPNSLRFWDANLISKVQSNPNLFTVEEWTSMHNDDDDVPDYMKELMINSFTKDKEWKFVVSSFKIDHD